MAMFRTAGLLKASLFKASLFKASLFKEWQRWVQALAFVEALYRSRRRHALTYRR